MPRTKLKIADRKDIFLYKTRVENIFINEFLPDAPGDYVKVYLFGLMYAQYEEEIDSLMMSRALGMKESEVEEAWDYWDAIGLVRKSPDGGEIEFIRMVENFYGKNEEDKTMQKRQTSEYDRTLTSEQMRMIFARFQEVSGRTVSRSETDKLTDALKVYEIKPEVLYYAIDYCADINHYSVDYITKVALRWKEAGCEDRESVKAFIEKHSERNSAYQEIFRAIGFSRPTSPADREIMDRWFDEMGYGLDEVLEACKATGGIREPSLKYVNKILENKMLEKGGVAVKYERNAQSGSAPSSGSGSATQSDAKVSRKVLREYYDFLRDEEEKAYATRIRDALSNIPGMEEVYEKEDALNKESLALLGRAGKEKREELKEARLQLEETKKNLLSGAGYPGDFLDRKYKCDICKDTGFTEEGTVCICCRARADEAYLWNLEKNKS